jgi:F-type H+-transporting ATPase subunit delta
VLARVLATPAVPATAKRAIVDQLLAKAGAVTPVVAKLLGLLADRDRLVLLPDIVAAYRTRLMEHAKVVRAEIVTAVALPGDRIDALRLGLARATGRRSEDVLLDNRVDPSIIGGAVAKIGSTIYDGSVTRQLEKMKEALVASAS